LKENWNTFPLLKVAPVLLRVSLCTFIERVMSSWSHRHLTCAVGWPHRTLIAILANGYRIHSHVKFSRPKRKGTVVIW